MSPIGELASHVRTSGIGRGCVKTDGDDFDRAKYGGKVDCRSILCKCFHQESPESKTENVVLCFYTPSAACCPWRPAWAAAGRYRPVSAFDDRQLTGIRIS